MKNPIEHSHLASVRHLLTRTGFAESPGTIVTASEQPLTQLLQQRLDSTAPISSVPPPEWVKSEIPARPDFKAMSNADSQLARKSINQGQNKDIDQLRIWWLKSLVTTPNPLAARMTLFWQSHFTSQQRKVRYGQLMYRQQATLMHHSLGNFGALLTDMLHDPALLIYLDNRSNRRKKPNENLARELLELFSLGEGNYQENDIKELARALTGLSVDKALNFEFRARFFDDGEKTILGTSGTLGEKDVVDILIGQSATAVFLTTKLWKYFVSPEPDSSVVENWAGVYRDSDYDMRVLLKTLFSSEQFNNPATHGQLIKSPVEFIVGAHRILEIPPIDDNSLLRASRSMQQTLYEPPNVRGWVGGNDWINSHTLLARRRFINQMLRDDGVDLKRLEKGMDNDAIIDSILPIRLETQDDSSKARPIIQALRSPAFQLC